MERGVPQAGSYAMGVRGVPHSMLPFLNDELIFTPKRGYDERTQDPNHVVGRQVGNLHVYRFPV